MSHTLTFTKMHGLGNDFMVMNNLAREIDYAKMPLTKWANRHIGVGFDQLLIIEPSSKADFFCRVFNADGSEAEQCGNGLRCVARFIHEEKLIDRTAFTIQTKAGVFPVVIYNYNQIQVTMGAPFIQANNTEFELSTLHATVSGSILSLGNPHSIVKVDTIETAPVAAMANEISQDSRFPDGVNVGFMQVMDRQHIKLRTIERGAGETCACGSNACAAAVTGIVNGWLDGSVRIEYSYGSLLINWDGQDQPIIMTGPAETIYKGQLMALLN